MNPFICGTIAHNFMKRMGHGSNCESDKPKESERRHKHHEPIPVPKWNNIDDFYRSLGVDPEKMKKPERPWKAMPKDWKLIDRSAVA